MREDHLDPSQDFVAPTNIAVDKSGDYIVTDWGGGSSPGCLVEVDPSIGKETVFAANAMAVNANRQYFSQPVGVTIDQSGNIFVARRLARPATRARFTFSAAGATGHVAFVCELDRQRPRPCRSPVTFRELQPGGHVFSVRATDSAGDVRTLWRTIHFLTVASPH